MSLRPYGSVSVLVLAGGRGDRLDLLTRKRAKPAVPFGGSFRIIDFVLSNCFHSGISEVAILTQYLPRSLEDHIAFGRDWDLDRVDAGLSYWHPFRGLDKSNWYGGTANALYENLRYLEESTADQFLVLSGDHIYRMDYRDLVARHEASMAPATVAVRPVPPEQAPQFGIFERDAKGQVVSFEEKPTVPRSNLASMGIYVFQRDFLLETLHRRGPDEPGLDFGKDLVPGWVRAGQLNIHAFDGYWLDVGTVDSYYKAHMDLLGPHPGFRLDDPDWPLITNSPQWAPLHVAAQAVLDDVLVSEGCRIHGTVRRSVLGPGVTVAEGAEVTDSVIMENCSVGPGARIARSILDKRVHIEGECQVGGEGAGGPNLERPDLMRQGLSLIGKDSRVPAGWRVGRNVRWALEDGGGLEHLFPDDVVPDGCSVLP